jgi:hypothetical protein
LSAEKIPFLQWNVLPEMQLPAGFSQSPAVFWKGRKTALLFTNLLLAKRF